MNSSFPRRIRVVFFCFFLFSFALIGKLFLVSVVEGEVYAERADRQYLSPSDIYERGTIFFSERSGKLISAATQVTGFKLVVNPSKMADSEEAYEKISGFIELDRGEFLKKTMNKNDPYEEIIYRLPKETADAILAQKIPGVSLLREKWRFYPGRNLASHVLGLVAYNENTLSGRYGLERQYDEVLSSDGASPYMNFFAEVFSNIKQVASDNELGQGDIITSIEPVTQGFFEEILEKVKDQYNADQVGGIVMDPRDGSIYALAAKPDFNPNNFKEADADLFQNPLVENVFELGSVVKPLVMAGGLDAGVVASTTTYNDLGKVNVEKAIIHNFDKKGRGVVDMQQVLSQSLNTGMVYVYNKLGRTRFKDYMLSYGIREKTGVDLPGEVSGLTANLNAPRELEYANASFGQGIALSPMQIIRALASLANGGKLVTPHLMERVRYDSGFEKEITYPVKDTTLKPTTSEEITSMLVKVMDEGLRGDFIKLEHHSIAVKTGTAQVAREDGRGYYEDRNTHSFFGYFPAYDPQFIIFLYAMYPKGVSFASQTWGPPFMDLAKFLVNYYEVPPDR